MSIPFYGGLNGQSFEIKETFNTHADIITDLGYGWNSPIGVGEYILINYGEPGTEEYIANRDVDGTVNWNGTIWQKIYDEDASTETSKAKGYVERPSTRNGLGYKLLFYSTGPIPKIKVTSRADYHVAQEPELILVPPGEGSETDLPDSYEYLLHLARNQEFSIPDAVVENAGTTPSVEDTTDETRDVITLTFHLPQGQVIQTTVPITPLLAGSDAQANFDQTNINRPQLQLSLPVGQTFEDGVTSRVIAAAETPSVQQSYLPEDTLHARPQLLFSLPQAQVMRTLVDLTVLNPSAAPTAAVNYTDATTKNEPYLTLGLPRAVNYYYGTNLAETGDHPDQSRASYDSNMQVEDYYVNTTLGFIHRVSAIDTVNDTISFTYVACLQAPLPTLLTTPVDTFNDDGTPAEINISRDVAPDRASWQITIAPPQTPDAAQTHEFVAPESGEEAVTVTKGTDAGVANNSTVQFNFKIPRGPRFFIGIAVDDANTSTVIADAGKGDYYINNGGAGNTSAGHVYKWNGTAWVIQEGFGLQGPAGEALNVIATETITDTEVADDTLQAVGAYLTNTLHYAPAPNELISVIYRDTSINDDKAYWYYRPGAQSDTSRPWARSNLTGGIGSFVERSYSTDGEKVYNTTYVNSLLVASPSDKDKQSYNAAQIDVLIANLTQRITDLEAALAKDIAEQEQWGKIRDLINETTNTDEP